VALAPYHESGCCLLMRALAAEGNAAEGLLVYERCGAC
jgi:DNA-binding SARP family transcriptional activator